MFIRPRLLGDLTDLTLAVIYGQRAPDSPAIRKGTIAKLFKQPQFKEKAGELSETDLQSLKADLENIVWYFPIEELDFVGYGCLAHYTQPGARIAREAIIDGQFKHFFGSEMKTGLNACDKLLAEKRSCLKTVPDALLAAMAADTCQGIRKLFAGQLSDARDRGIAACHMAFMQKAPRGGKLGGGMSEGHVLSAQAYALDTPGEAQTYFKSLLALMEEKIGPAGMAPGMMFLKIVDAKLTPAIQRGFGYSIETVQAIIEAQTAPYGERQSILEKRFAEAFAKERAMCIQAGRDTLRAVLAGANLCPSAMKDALECVMKQHEVQDAIARSMMSLRRAGGASAQVGSTTTTSTQGRGSGQTSAPGRGRVGGRGSAAQNSAMTSSPADSTEAKQQLAGWSVDQWARWIEGPPTRKTDQATDPRKVASLLKAARSKQLDDEDKLANRAGQPASSGSRTDTVFDAESVHQTLQAALRASADYFGGDIDETLLLGHSVIDPFDKKPLSELKEELEALRKPDDIDEVQARALFGKIDAAVLHVRAMAQEVERKKAALRREEAEIRREKVACARFATELQTALQAKSAVSIGKRTGGDILLRDPKPMDFWEPISRDYHGRYVPLSMVLEGGVPRALDEDEALALYVTGGSKSGAAFCVSVHHWRRYPGSDAPPSAGAFEPMDQDHWYDTFNPCCVLHVRAS